MSDLIKREDAIKAVEECLKLLARPRYTVKTAIEAIPSVDIPHSDDWEKYSDKLWKTAYERGKADRPQGEWISTLSGHWKCSRCNCKAGFWFEEENSCEWDMDMSEWLSDYCPNCGADMKGEQDDNN